MSLWKIMLNHYLIQNQYRKNGIQRAVSRKRGCMPADSFVEIWKFIARPNLCGTPACVKPPPRWLQCAGDSAFVKTRAEKKRKTDSVPDYEKKHKKFYTIFIDS